ncbi:MAG: hypothetical protein ACOY9D_07250 [Pseudomonadota bacterium]
MNSIPKSSFVKRRIIYVDEKVQKGLLIALVSFEILLIAGTLWMLYLQMSEIVDANLYRVHFSEKPDIYPLLLKTALIGVAGLAAINVLVLWVASWVWARQVASILKPFRELISKVEALDFREDAPMAIPHKVAELALTWRHSKRQDLLKLREEIARLDKLGDLSDAGTRVRARASLEAIREILPNW